MWMACGEMLADIVYKRRPRQLLSSDRHVLHDGEAGKS